MTKIGRFIKQYFPRIIISLASFFFIIFVIDSILEKITPLDRNDLYWEERYVKLNSVGYRDKEYPIDKPTDSSLRIYSTGDSFTYGWLLNNVNDSYPKMLEKKLYEKLGRKVEVINGSYPGFSLAEKVQRYISQGVRYHPDIVLLQVTDPPPDRSTIRRKDLFLPSPILGSYFYNLTIGQIFKSIAGYESRAYFLKTYTDKNSKKWNEFTKLVLQLQKVASKYNTAVGIVIYPHVDPAIPNTPYDFFPYNMRIKEFADQHNIYVIDPLDEFIKYKHKEKLMINDHDAHPTKEMNQLIINAFLKQFPAEDFMAHRTPYTPQIRTFQITNSTFSIPPYDTFRKASDSDSNSLPILLFNTSKKSEEFPIPNENIRYFANVFQSINPEDNLTGADIVYYVPSGKNGEVKIPTTIYGYPVVGLDSIYGLYVIKGRNFNKSIEPLEIYVKDNLMFVRYNQDHDYRLLKFTIKVAVKQVNIDPLGNIKSISQVVRIMRTVDSNIKTITVPFPSGVSVLPEFYAQGKKLPYVYVDGIFTKVHVSRDNKSATITFDKDLRKGQIVSFFAQVPYTLENNEIISVEVE